MAVSNYHPEEGETKREVAVRVMDLQMKWVKKCTTAVEDVQEVIGIEQFMNTLKPEKKLWVMEHKPETCLKAVLQELCNLP